MRSSRDILSEHPGSPPASRRIMIIAGEPSGDLHGAHLVRALRKRDPHVSLSGIGGDAMAREGMTLLFHIRALSVMGVTEVAKNMRTIAKVFYGIKRHLRTDLPDLLILIDYPGFNLKMACAARAARVPVLYYITPKVWAWKRSRLEKIKKCVDHAALIFPFEVPLYRKRGIPCTFVGHPLLDCHDPAMSHQNDFAGLDLVIGLLPGSRNSEIDALLETLLEASLLIARRIPRVKILLSAAPSVDMARFRAILTPRNQDFLFEVVTGDVTRILSSAHLLIAASGTVSLEAALFRVPTIIVYKMSPLTYQLARRLVRIKHVGLANIIAGDAILPELLQGDATPEKISALVFSLVEGEGLRAMKKRLEMIPSLLGGGGAAARVAALALEMAGHFTAIR